MNEFVARDVSQVKMQYLVQIAFNGVCFDSDDDDDDCNSDEDLSDHDADVSDSREPVSSFDLD